MKILALIIQNKKGQNLLTATTNSISDKLILDYSIIIFEFIIKQFKKGKKIDRSFLLENSITCICNITKDHIISCLVSNFRGIFSGYDALKKANEYIKNNYKNLISEKKYPELLSVLEEFLFTREIRFAKLNINFMKSLTEKNIQYEFAPMKKISDCEILDKFQHVSFDLEKNMIANIPLKYAKKNIAIEKEEKILHYFSDLYSFFNSQKLSEKEISTKKSNRKFATICKTTVKKKILLKKNNVEPKKPNNFSATLAYIGLSSEDAKKMIKNKSIKSDNMIPLESNQSRNKNINDNKNQINNENKNTEYSHNLIDLDIDMQMSNFEKGPINFESTNGNQNVDLLSDDIDFTSKEIIKAKPSSYNSIPKPLIDNNSNQKNIDLLILDDYKDQSFNPNNVLTNDNKGIGYNDDVFLKIIEKSMITFMDGKIKDLKIFGQLLIESELPQTNIKIKLNEEVWSNNPNLQKRISPNSISQINNIGNDLYEINIFEKNNDAKSLIDYIISAKCVKIPLLVVYKSNLIENKESFTNLSIHYKKNENLLDNLNEVEMSIVLKNDVFFEDIQTIPPANSFQNHILLWKNLPNTNKGKLQLNITKCNKSPNQMIDFIHIMFSLKTLVIEGMDAKIIFPENVFNTDSLSRKKAIYEYKILPNSAI